MSSEPQVNEEIISGSRTARIVDKCSMFPRSEVSVVVFEIITIWLLSLSPMSFKCLIFSNFDSIERMWKGTFLRGHFIDLFLNNWTKERIRLKKHRTYIQFSFILRFFFKFLEKNTNTFPGIPSISHYNFDKGHLPWELLGSYVDLGMIKLEDVYR